MTYEGSPITPGSGAPGSGAPDPTHPGHAPPDPTPRDISPADPDSADLAATVVAPVPDELRAPVLETEGLESARVTGLDVDSLLSAPPPGRPAAPPAWLLKGAAAGLLLIALSLCLDLWGIRWGLPDSRHFYSYHPDEWTVIRGAQHLSPASGVFTPGFYNYSSLYMDLLAAALAAAQACGVLAAHLLSVQGDSGSAAMENLIARLLTVIFSTGTVTVTAILGLRLFGYRTGFLAGLMLALAPLFVVHSHYATVDVPAAFWMTLATLGCAFALPSRRVRPLASRSRKGSGNRPPLALVLAAAAAGLAAGTKYNAGLALLPCWYTWHCCLRKRQASGSASSGRFHRAGDLLFGSSLLAAIAFGAFLLSTPGFIVDQAHFLSDFWYEIQHQRGGPGFGVTFAYTQPAFLYHISQSLRIGMGPPLCVLCLVGALFAAARRTPADKLLAFAALPYFLVIGVSQVKFMRYAIPLLPILCVWGARLIAACLESRRSTIGPAEPGDGRSERSPVPAQTSWVDRPAVRRAAAAGIGIICIVFALIETTAYDRIFAGRDVRDEAGDWIEAHIRTGDSIGLPAPPWFDAPPLSPHNYPPAFADVLRGAADSRYRLIVTGWGASKLETLRPHYYVLTEWQSRDLERIYRLDPRGKSSAAKSAREAAAMLAALHRQYVNVRTFQRPPRLGPFIFRWGFVPEDWLYPNPTISIYRRR